MPRESIYDRPYPLYIEPDPFGQKYNNERTKPEAREYFKWFVEHFRERIPILLVHFGENLSGDPIADLMRFGKHAVECCKRDWCAYLPEEAEVVMIRGEPLVLDISREATARGCSLAIDIGMLMAHYLLQEEGLGARWTLNTRTKELDYLTPVVRVTEHMAFDPKEDSIGNMDDIASGEGGFDAWADSYVRYRSKQDGWPKE